MATINDENLVFETSNEISIAPTFDSMGLKEDLLRGIYAYSMLLLLNYRFRETVGYSTESNYANC